MNSVTIVVQNNSWDLTARILRIYGRRQGHDIRSWHKEQRAFLRSAIEQEVQSSLDRNDAYTARLILTALLQRDIDRGAPRPRFDEKFRKKLEKKRAEVEAILKKKYGLESPPQWSKHLDWLSQE